MALAWWKHERDATKQASYQFQCMENSNVIPVPRNLPEDCDYYRLQEEYRHS